jgi:TM2 domain-containing membrane protein YozV
VPIYFSAGKEQGVPNPPDLAIIAGIRFLASMKNANPLVETSHNIPMGYILWNFGFTGAHRFYYGRPVTGTIWFFTLGLLGIG